MSSKWGNGKWKQSDQQDGGWKDGNGGWKDGKWKQSDQQDGGGQDGGNQGDGGGQDCAWSKWGKYRKLNVEGNAAQKMACSLDLPRTITVFPDPTMPADVALRTWFHENVPARAWRIVCGDFNDLKRFQHDIYNQHPSSLAHKQHVFHGCANGHQKGSRSPLSERFSS